MSEIEIFVKTLLSLIVIGLVLCVGGGMIGDSTIEPKVKEIAKYCTNVGCALFILGFVTAILALIWLASP